MNDEVSEGVPALGGHCVKCGHVWIVGYAPIEIRLLGQLAKRAMCPKCGAKGRDIAIAKDAEVRAVLAREGRA